MNLLIHHTPAASDAWKSDFDASTETRITAGLTQPRLWREVDGTGVTGRFMTTA